MVDILRRLFPDFAVHWCALDYPRILDELSPIRKLRLLTGGGISICTVPRAPSKEADPSVEVYSVE